MEATAHLVGGVPDVDGQEMADLLGADGMSHDPTGAEGGMHPQGGLGQLHGGQDPHSDTESEGALAETDPGAPGSGMQLAQLPQRSPPAPHLGARGQLGGACGHRRRTAPPSPRSRPYPRRRAAALRSAIAQVDAQASKGSGPWALEEEQELLRLVGDEAYQKVRLAGGCWRARGAQQQAARHLAALPSTRTWCTG